MILAGIVIPAFFYGQAYQHRAGYFSAHMGFRSEYEASLKDYFKSEDFKNSHAGSVSTYVSLTGPYVCKYESALGERFGFGLHVGYLKLKWNVEEEVSIPGGAPSQKPDHVISHYNYESTSVSGRVNCHILNNAKFIDWFVGIDAGLKLVTLTIGKHKVDYLGSKNYIYRPLHFAATTGVRIFLIKGLGVIGEVGWEKSARVILGIVLKIPPKTGQIKK